jgi:phage gpG-like protein
MELRLEFTRESRRRWDEFWGGLADIGRLSHREAQIVVGAARAGIRSNFEHERAPDGTPWDPLAPRTVAERREGIDERGIPFRVGGHHPILKRTGDLQRSFTDPDHPRNVMEITQVRGLTFLVLSAEDDPKTPNRIKRLHAGGRTEDGAVVPARPFIGLSERYEDQLYEQADRVIRQRVERLRGV